MTIWIKFIIRNIKHGSKGMHVGQLIVSSLENKVLCQLILCICGCVNETFRGDARSYEEVVEKHTVRELADGIFTGFKTCLLHEFCTSG